MRGDGVEVALHVRKVLLQVRLGVNGGGVHDGKNVVEGQVGVGQVVGGGTKEEHLVLENRVEALLQRHSIQKRREERTSRKS